MPRFELETGNPKLKNYSHGGLSPRSLASRACSATASGDGAGAAPGSMVPGVSLVISPIGGARQDFRLVAVC